MRDYGAASPPSPSTSGALIGPAFFAQKIMESGPWLRTLRAMRKIFVVTVALGLAGAAAAAENFWQRLTPAERAAAGIAELTPQQQAALDQLAQRFAREDAQQAVARVQAEVKQKKADNAGLAVREDDEPVRTRIAGEFRGWEGRTNFHLENGQVWQQDDRAEKFWFNATQNPEIELRPSKLGGWKLYVLPADRWVRVRRVR